MTKLTEYRHTAAAAEYLGVAQNTIRKWASRGDIPRLPQSSKRLPAIQEERVGAIPPEN